MISFIVPAHNEESCLPKTLKAIQTCDQAVNELFEIIVVNDSSTDATREIALAHGAKVIDVGYRQIAATRNAGARAASGTSFFFVDADTTVTASGIRAALQAMDKGAVGGGALTRFDPPVPLYARLLMVWLGFFMRIASLSGGAFMFCTRTAFEKAAGFDERLFGAEDAVFSAALKSQGRFCVIQERLFTSGRRVRSINGLQTLGLLARIAVMPSDLRDRSNVERVWYTSNRSAEHRISGSLSTHVSNFIALLILAFLITLPIWLVPWPVALVASPLGQVRLGAKLLIAHLSLFLWPCAFFLLRSLLREKQFGGRLKTALLILLSLWIAGRATFRVLTLWTGVIRWFFT
jgi:glycosyltransferase involved in cell wall biosynthesis